jgi:PKD repeat protein
VVNLTYIKKRTSNYGFAVGIFFLLFLVMPSAAANITATVSPSTVAHGEKIFINGTAEGQPSSVAIWILGKNFAIRQTETVNVDGSFSYEVTEDTTQAMYGEQYYVVVQHPGMNGVYDIDVCGIIPQDVCDYSGTTPVILFKMWGPGNLQGFDAFEALTQAIKINQPRIDDTYTKAQFLIMPNLTATVSPSTVTHGEKIFINGTAEGQPSSVAIWILGKNFATRQMEPVNVDGSFSYEVTEDTTQAMYGEQYYVVVQHPGMNGVYDIDVCGIIPQDVCDYSGTTPVILFKMWGPGSLQGFDAFEALTQAIKNNQPYIDDTYTKVQFLILSSLPGFTNPPTDPDSDGLYEDLNGNGRKDFNDVVLMFNQMQWIAANEPLGTFDFNGNGRIDFNDIVKLFGEI